MALHALTSINEIYRASSSIWCASYDVIDVDAIAIASANGEIVVVHRRARAGASARAVEPRPHDRAVRFIAHSPCGRALASASFDGTCGIFARQRERAKERWEKVCALEGHESEAKACAWNASGSLLATCGRDRTVWIWEAHGEREFDVVAALHGHQGDVKHVQWHPSEDALISVSYDESVRVWREDLDGDDWHCAQVLGGENGIGGEGHHGTVWRASFEPRKLMDGRNGTRMATCGGDGEIIVWNGSGFCHTELSFGTRFACGHDQAVLSCSWGRHGFIAAGGGDNSVRVYGEIDGEWREVARVENAHDDDVNCVEWSPHDPMELLSASDDGTVKAWRFSMT